MRVAHPVQNSRNGPVPPGWYASLGPGLSVLNGGIGLGAATDAAGNATGAFTYGLLGTKGFFLTGVVNGSRTVDNTRPGKTNLGAVRATLTSPLSPKTDFYGGMRYQISRSDISLDYNEFAVFVGLNHRFH